MASKKYTLVLALLGLMQTASFAQTNSDASEYVLDSSKVSTSRMPQYNEFAKNQYPYPAKPKDMWEIGGGVGLGLVLGDRPIFTGKYNGGITGNLSLRKSLGHVVSLRGSYSGSIVSIPRYDNGFTKTLWAKNYTHMLGLEGLFALNNIRFYKGDPKVSLYAIAGYQLVATKVEQYRASDNQLHILYYQPNNTITTLGGAEVSQGGRAPRQGWALLHAASAGAGIAFKLSPKFNIALEQRFIVPVFGQDYLDGYKGGTASDMYSYSTVRLNMNIGNSATHVEPLWWKNPLNYVYNEVNHPKHMKLDPPVLPDADGDGVTDQFDLEPNTPAGASVDSHGRAKDTDGDGVPDYKDKEILTQANCFPVNADGVGTCPEPACCTELRKRIDSLTTVSKCNISSLPSVTFKSGSARLSKDAQNILTGAAAQLRNSATCNVRVVGYAADASKRSQQLSWDRVNAVIKYLVEKQGIAESRIIFSYENTGDNNTVDLQPTTDSGPNTVPAPHPQLRTTR